MSDESNKPLCAGLKPTIVELEAGTYSWCACGRSLDQPFCDGSHNGTQLAPMEFTLAEKKKVSLCTCKLTKNPPFCDGAHKALKKD